MKIPRAKKSLGQHFLHNAGVIQRITDMIRLDPTDNVLEIGPGPGALTSSLREKKTARLILIEKDDYWAAHHAALCPPDGRESVIHGDALAFSWQQLAGPWKIVGNLPYNIASPLMWDIVSKTRHLARAVFMVQKEVAERLYARPGNRDYGALSVWIQSFVDVEWGFVVAPGNFSPPPKVDSAVIAFTPPKTQKHFDAGALAVILKLCFGQRRKQLQGILRKHGVHNPEQMLEQLHIPATARPEELSVQNFHELSFALMAYQKNTSLPR